MRNYLTKILVIIFEYLATVFLALIGKIKVSTYAEQQERLEHIVSNTAANYNEFKEFVDFIPILQRQLEIVHPSWKTMRLENTSEVRKKIRSIRVKINVFKPSSLQDDI